jgi:hypothetical protein
MPVNTLPPVLRVCRSGASAALHPGRGVEPLEQPGFDGVGTFRSSDTVCIMHTRDTAVVQSRKAWGIISWLRYSVQLG